MTTRLKRLVWRLKTASNQRKDPEQWDVLLIHHSEGNGVVRSDCNYSGTVLRSVAGYLIWLPVCLENSHETTRQLCSKPPDESRTNTRPLTDGDRETPVSPYWANRDSTLQIRKGARKMLLITSYKANFTIYIFCAATPPLISGYQRQNVTQTLIQMLILTIKKNTSRLKTVRAF